MWLFDATSMVVSVLVPPTRKGASMDQEEAERLARAIRKAPVEWMTLG